MRSHFFQEIAESRERFYSRQFGDDPREPDHPALNRVTEAGNQSENQEWANSTSKARRGLLLNFLGKMRFWIGF